MEVSIWWLSPSTSSPHNAGTYLSITYHAWSPPVNPQNKSFLYQCTHSLRFWPIPGKVHAYRARRDTKGRLGSKVNSLLSYCSTSLTPQPRYARVDRRPLDPPPVVQLKLYHVYTEGTDQEYEQEVQDYE